MCHLGPRSDEPQVRVVHHTPRRLHTMTIQKMQVTTLSLRVWIGQMDLVKRAAKTFQMTVPDYVRYRFIPVCAKDAGVDLPTFPPFGQPGRPGTVTPEVNAAAKRLGISPRELMSRAIAAAVDAALRIGTEPPAAPNDMIATHWGKPEVHQ